MKMIRKIALLAVAAAGVIMFSPTEAKAQYDNVPKVDGIQLLDQGTLPDQTNVMDYITEKYKGKVIYMDLWAAWCAPCMAQFKDYSPKMHDAYQGKDVVFVNICFESPDDKWKEAIDGYNIHGENYSVPAGQGQAILAAFGLNGFPSYMIFDKEGKLITNKAPRPSSLDEAKAIIDPLL